MTAFSSFAADVYRTKYELNGEGWEGTANRVASHVLGALGYRSYSDEVRSIAELITQRKFIPGGRYLYATGRDLHQTQNCLLMRAEDSREGWADLMRKAGMGLMTGAGIGVEYSHVRGEGSPISKTGGLASGPLSLMGIVNEIGRRVMQGGSRRSALWAGLAWDHPDTPAFIRLKDWSPEVRKLKAADFNFPATMDMTNISIRLDDGFFWSFHHPDDPKHGLAHEVYNKALSRMLKTGEPGFSIDIGINADETLRNACTEITSADSDDICNLGSINMARIEGINELVDVVNLATLFLIAGTVYSDLPYPEVDVIRSKNRRLGLGLMGMHEWLLQRGKPYGPDDELARWLGCYEDSGHHADSWADYHGLSRPVATRAIAPTGTIGIVAETTTGIEPIYVKAYKRRYLKAHRWHYQYVADPTAKRLIDAGIDPDAIEDAYTLAGVPERRVAFQAWVQQYVDHGISSTINLPGSITDPDEVFAFGSMLMCYLPQLRGVTVYPDGARGGQPLTPVPYSTAVRHAGVLFQEDEERCVGGVCGL